MAIFISIPRTWREENVKPYSYGSVRGDIALIVHKVAVLYNKPVETSWGAGRKKCLVHHIEFLALVAFYGLFVKHQSVTGKIAQG
jgi:hypothetical protein